MKSSAQLCGAAVLLLLQAVGSLTAVQGMEVSSVEVPRYLLLGESATLACHFRLQDEVLYSLTWWKDGRQFYSYIPSNSPRVVVFNVPGVTVNIDASREGRVELVGVTAATGGQYRCELVGEGPTFTTTFASANLSIINTPDGPPVIRGLKDLYHEGDVISLTCTSYRSFPAAQLSWSIKEDEELQQSNILDDRQSLQPRLGKIESVTNKKVKGTLGLEQARKNDLPRSNIRMQIPAQSEILKGKDTRASDHTAYGQAADAAAARKTTAPIPFTYSTKFNRSAIPTNHGKFSEVLEDLKNISSDVHGKAQNYLLHSRESSSYPLFFSFRSLKSISLANKQPTLTHKRTFYSKKKLFGWREVKDLRGSSASPFFNQDNSLYSKDNSYDYPMLSELVSQATNLRHATTLQELTLPPHVQKHFHSSTPGPPLENTYTTTQMYHTYTTTQVHNSYTSPLLRNTNEHTTAPHYNTYSKVHHNTVHHNKQQTERVVREHGSLSAAKELVNAHVSREELPGLPKHRLALQTRAVGPQQHAPSERARHAFRQIEKALTEEQPPVVEVVWRGSSSRADSEQTVNSSNRGGDSNRGRTSNRGGTSNREGTSNRGGTSNTEVHSNRGGEQAVSSVPADGAEETLYTDSLTLRLPATRRLARRNVVTLRY
ncbi:uncharacterized protein LOC125179208 [Hyalella azteca]|uniref:Uncharacterized protein LOC125179208 n=1 Tax=Hyalella azteca TaxID=294128 RepID=A0A979FTP6_HYAAZ|nr:uncharacterized protein LOC125179208 [Hyalella azteca]